MRKIRKNNKKNGSRKISDKIVENRWNQVSAELVWIPAWWCLTCFPVKSQQHRQALTEITKVKWCDMHLPRSSRPFLQSCFAFRPAYHWSYFISSSFDNFFKEPVLGISAFSDSNQSKASWRTWWISWTTSSWRLRKSSRSRSILKWTGREDHFSKPLGRLNQSYFLKNLFTYFEYTNSRILEILKKYSECKFESLPI